MNYQETGNKIPVTESELINVMIAKYDAYAKSQNSTSPLPNPDSENIVYTTQEGKTIKIPDEIKMKAKTMWIKDLAKRVENKQVTLEEVGISPPKQVVQIYDENQKFTNIIILIAAVLIALYLLYTYGGKLRDTYNIGTEELKFYLNKK